jgi:hypothetical protein
LNYLYQIGDKTGNMKVIGAWVLACLIILQAEAQENAAPSIHLICYFPSEDAILKMQKIKILRSGDASYFEVNGFANGYAGLQQTPDLSFGTPNILIYSLWDPDTKRGVNAKVEYTHSSTQKSRFGGEGDGWKTINSYRWKKNRWYNLVNRAWKSHGRLFIGIFVLDIATQKWFHSATLSIPDPGKYLTARNDAFMENWDGANPLWDGSIVRKALFKDCWILNDSCIWEKNTKATFRANGSQDIKRDGKYHNRFNAYLDTSEDAYCMQHGGNTRPSAAFNHGRTIDLPLVVNPEIAPSLTKVMIRSMAISTGRGKVKVSWTVDNSKSPPLSAKLEIVNASGNTLATMEDTVPQRRNFTLHTVLAKGKYVARLSAMDIFNQWSSPLGMTFFVGKAD